MDPVIVTNQAGSRVAVHKIDCRVWLVCVRPSVDGEFAGSFAPTQARALASALNAAADAVEGK
jgi:hypothetical protein